LPSESGARGAEQSSEGDCYLLGPADFHVLTDLVAHLAAFIIRADGPAAEPQPARFPAPDQAALEDIQNVMRKRLAWASIVRDARGLLQLPPAQVDDAKKKLAEQKAPVNAVRRGWKHLLLPQEVQPGSPNAARGFDLDQPRERSGALGAASLGEMRGRWPMVARTIERSEHRRSDVDVTAASDDVSKADRPAQHAGVSAKGQ
jgi:hypothetical protein